MRRRPAEVLVWCAMEPETVPRRSGPAPGRPAVVGGLVAAIALAAALLTDVVVAGGRPTVVDEAVQRFTREWADSVGWVVTAAEFLGRVTGPLLSVCYAAVVFAVFAARRSWAIALFVGISAAGGALAVEIAKLAVGRLRPPGAVQYVTDLEKSFPSGHAAAGIYLYLVLGLIAIRHGRAVGARRMEILGLLLLVLGPIIGLSRIVLGVHWASDVAAGWAFGSAAALTSALLVWEPLARSWGSRSGAGPPGAVAAPEDAEPGG